LSFCRVDEEPLYFRAPKVVPNQSPGSEQTTAGDEKHRRLSS
jgi:hypothetical protein